MQAHFLKWKRNNEGKSKKGCHNMPDDMDNLKTLPPTQNVNNGSLTFNPDNVHEANGANQVPHLQALTQFVLDSTTCKLVIP